MNKYLNKKWLIYVASVSILINIIVILPYIKPYYKKIRNKFFPAEHFETNVPDSIVLDKVLKETVNFNSVKMSMNEQKGLFKDLKAFFKPTRNIAIKNNYYTSYGLAGASYYAIYKNDSIQMLKLKEKADNYVDSSNHRLNYNIEKIDQTPIGILFLNLYKYYHNNLYFQVAKNLFEDINAMRKDSIIYYASNSDCQLNDALGMYIPFLMEYFEISKDSLAYKIADYNMKQYYKYGVNKETGIPSHGYNIQSKIQVGSANWGRGIGWYLIAAAYCPQFKDERLDISLRNMNYSQFPGSSQDFDSSTALMFEIYKQSKNKNRKLNLNFIKPHILKTGFVDDCSGDTYGLNNYSHTFSESELCNGLLLILSSKFKN